MDKKGVDKKGQITFFIIIGIVLIIASGIFFYVTYAPSADEQADVQQLLEEVPSEFRPVHSLVQQCLYNTAVRGLERLGRHGGYIEPTDISYMFNDMAPTDADGFRVFPNDPMTSIPYWYYFYSPNECDSGCQCSSKKPALYDESGPGSIESQLEAYIENNLDNCLNNFIVFATRGISVQAGEPEVDFRVRNSDIAVYMEMPIETKKMDVKGKFDKFFVTIPVDLRRMYELAEELTRNQMEHNYIERWTIELTEAASFGPRADGMPPSVATTFDPGGSPVFWSKTKSKELLVNNILTPNIPMLQVFGTGNYRVRDGIYQKTTLPVVSPTNSSYSDLDVTFEYLPFWPIYYDITGRGISGEIIGPESGIISYFSFLGIHRYYYYQDISYPVKIDIYDPAALNNRGYHFIFALESNIRDNKPLNCSGEGPDILMAPVGSMMCNYEQRCADVTVIARDVLTGKTIKDVQLMYGAGHESCVLGATAFDEQEKISKAEVGVPQCVGAGCTFTAKKHQYLAEPQSFSVKCDADDSCTRPDVVCSGEAVIIDMIKLKPMELSIMVKPVRKNMIADAEDIWEEWTFTDSPRYLLRNERAIISFMKIKENDAEEDFGVTVLIDGTKASTALYPGLVPGEYKVNINLIYDLPDFSGKKAVIFDAVTERLEGGIFDDDEEIILGPYTFNDTFMEGGAEFEFTITAEDLKNDNIMMYAISAPDFASFNMLDFHDIGLMGESRKLSADNRVAIEPQFS